jgi:hypothetical protein
MVDSGEARTMAYGAMGNQSVVWLRIAYVIRLPGLQLLEVTASYFQSTFNKHHNIATKLHF